MGPVGDGAMSPGDGVGPGPGIDGATVGDDAVDPLDPCPNQDTPCDDGNCCTVNDSCVHCDNADCETPFVCEGSPVNCDDEMECTLDECTCLDGAPECTHDVAADGTACDYSGNDCTEGDQCEAGQCAPGPVASLDDENPCTQDLCIKGVIEHQPLNEGQCDDGNECTSDDSCVLGTCTGGPTIECEVPECAGSASCVPDYGCVPSWMPEGATCDAADACTEGDACDADHACVGGETIECEVPECALSASCDAEGGCVVEWMAEGSSCDDDSPCTVDDGCVAGVGCVGEPDDEQECDDGDESTCGDACVGGVCETTFCGDTCEVPIELGDGGTLEVDLCDFQQDYDYGWCASSGPELFFTVQVNYSQGSIVMDTTGSFPGILVNYRWWSLESCEDENSYEVNGFCYNGPAGIGWGGYNPDNVLYFGVSSLDGTCGPVKISASTACSVSCWDKDCGDDGCGGICGECSMDAPYCVDGLCEGECVPACDGAVCGDDGCGDLCGHCEADQTCSSEGLCIAF